MDQPSPSWPRSRTLSTRTTSSIPARPSGNDSPCHHRAGPVCRLDYGTGYGCSKAGIHAPCNLLDRVAHAKLARQTPQETAMADMTPTVVVTDIKIPFWSLVVLMVKWALAAIP